MEQAIIKQYINTFRNTFGQFLVSGVGIQVSVSELPDKVFICFKVGKNLLDSSKFGGMLNTVAAALKYHGFTDDVLERGERTGTEVLIQGMKFAIIKSLENKNFEDKVAVSDSINIAKHILSTKKG